MKGKRIMKWVVYPVVVITLLLVILLSMNEYYINFLWFDSVGYTDVFTKELTTKIQMGLGLFFVSLLLSIIFFKLSIKSFFRNTPDMANKLSTKRTLLLCIGISLFIAISATNDLWYVFLEFYNAVDFNIEDPLFHRDVSFYVFKLPFLEKLLSVFIYIFIFFIIVTIGFTAYLYISHSHYNKNALEEPKRMKSGISDVRRLAYGEAGIFVGLFLYILAFGYYIKSYLLLYSNKGIAYGASYIDVKITLPMYVILFVLAIIFGTYSFYCGFQRKVRRLIIGPSLIVIVSILGAGLTASIDRFVIKPNEYQKEKPYLMEHIKNTQIAYGIDSVEEKQMDIDEKITREDIKENQITIDNIPINDYRPTLDMFNSIQGFRIYYEFNDIDIDRYYVDDKYTQVFISAREMNNRKLDGDARTWINTHLKYTHGYGVAVSPVNTVNKGGQPSLIVGDIPPETNAKSLQIEEPRIYYGESMDSYAITNASTMEFDYPLGSENVENSYGGNGGIPMTILNRVAFALHYNEGNILLSSEINDQSRMHIHRNIIERVSQIAPFLLYDEDPYIVIAEGRLYWIIDGFTTSDRFPYSQPYDEEHSFNYIRNSVKVVVDAYNGDVNFYQVDKEDAILNVYNKIYTNMFKPVEDMPESIRSHIRYSQEMFDIQSNVYKTYHMNNPQVFYNKEDQWEIATQTYAEDLGDEDVESAYLVMKQPESYTEEFVLMVPYTPRQKDNLVGWMAAMNDEEDYGKLVVYKFPKQHLVYGPMQIEQRINQDTNISPQLTLLGQQGSKVSRGNMLVIPIGNSILYVEPIYISSSGAERGMPEVKKVIVSYGNEIVMADTLEQSLQKLFGVLEAEKNEESQVEEEHDEENENTRIKRAVDLLQKAQESQESGNWSDYEKYIKELKDVLN